MSTPTERRPVRARPRSGSRPRRVEGLERLRVLLVGALGAVLVGYALTVPVAGLLLASGGTWSVEGAFAVGVPLWLAAHLIPVEVQGRPLGVLPLLSTVVVVLVVATASAWTLRRLGGRLRQDAGAVVATHAGATAAVAVLAGAFLPGDLGMATPWASMVGAGLLAGLGAAAGVLRACGLPPGWARRLRGWPMAGIAGARAGALGLVLSGSSVLLIATAVHAGDVAASFAALAPGVGAGAGVLVLVVGYLPNAIMGGVSWSLGAGVGVGAGAYGPFDASAGPLPPFPLFAVLGQAPSWTAFVLVLPLATGVLVGRVCRRALGREAPVRDRLAASGAAALLTALGVAVVAAMAGGSLAGGPYDPVSLSPAAAGTAALLLLGVPATLACVGVDELLGRPPARTSRRVPGGSRPGTRAASTDRRRDERPRGDDRAREERSRDRGRERHDSPRGDGVDRDGTGRRGRQVREDGPLRVDRRRRENGLDRDETQRSDQVKRRDQVKHRDQRESAATADGSPPRTVAELVAATGRVRERDAGQDTDRATDRGSAEADDRQPGRTADRPASSGAEDRGAEDRGAGDRGAGDRGAGDDRPDASGDEEIGPGGAAET